MPRSFVVIIIALLTHVASAQWTFTNAPPADRYDDVFFIGADTGWAAGGSEGTIIRTYDGGESWQEVFDGPGYLRSIEFATPQVGFCGTLDNRFLRTTDGGDSWQNIAGSITPPVTGICGLSAPTPERIHGVGVWSQPAYVIRSSDGGDTWTSTSLAGTATSLVDVLFLNADTGYIAGQASPLSAGGIIMRTVDGGDTWTTVHTTGTAFDYVWKLQSPDGVHIYGSIEGPPGNGTRYTHSSDGGLTWDTDTITMDYYYVQVIGFLDTLRGWTGGYGQLLGTTDGGENWQPVFLGSAYDRFHRVDANTAYMTGTGIYKFDDLSTSSAETAPRAYPERIAVSQNPALENTWVELSIKASSSATINLFDAGGRWLEEVHRGTLTPGEHRIPLATTGLPPGTYHVALRTNEGHIATTFQVQ